MIASIQTGSFLWYLILPHVILVCYFGVTCLFYALSTMPYVNSISIDPKKVNINGITQSVKSQKNISHFHPSNTAYEHSGTKKRERERQMWGMLAQIVAHIYLLILYSTLPIIQI